MGRSNSSPKRQARVTTARRWIGRTWPIIPCIRWKKISASHGEAQGNPISRGPLNPLSLQTNLGISKFQKDHTIDGQRQPLPNPSETATALANLVDTVLPQSDNNLVTWLPNCTCCGAVVPAERTSPPIPANSPLTFDVQLLATQ